MKAMLKIIRRYPELIFFGILTAFFSGPGQTFLVSLFIPSMREEFGLSQTQIAGLYSLATLFSALCLPWIGKLLDKFHLTKFTVLAGVLLAFGCLVLANSAGMATVLAGFFLLRNLGQGTLTLISSTTMARVFGAMRGKALGLSNLGYPVGEAVFPLLISSWILAYGWRSAWIFLAALTLIVLIPATVFLLKRDAHGRTQRAIEKEFSRESETKGIGTTADRGVADMLKDRRFYLILFPLLIPPGFFTALFFHQLHLAAWKGWSVSVISASFIVFGGTRAVVSFLVGPWIDRLSARAIFPFNLIPLIFGLSAYLFGAAPVWSFVYLGFAGMTMGLSMTISGALFAEFYGTRQLGSIRGFTASLIILSTAAAPVVLGSLLDAGINPAKIILTMIFVTAAGSLSSWKACLVK